MTPKQKSQLRDFDKLCTRVKALVSFKKLHTVADVFKEFNHNLIEPWSNKGANEINLAGLQEIIAKLHEEYLYDIGVNKLVDLLPTIEQIKAIKSDRTNYEDDTVKWQDSDSIIETTPPKYSAHEGRLCYLRQFKPKNIRAHKAELRYFQEEAVLETWYKIKEQGLRSILCPAKTGDGKTFYAGELILFLLDSGFLEGKTCAPYPILYVTKASIVEQTKADLQEWFNINTTTEVVVTNYDQLRATLGEEFLEQIATVEDGVVRKIWKFKPFLNPAVIIYDETHANKNTDTTQSEISQSYNDINYKCPPQMEDPFYPGRPLTLQIHMSATPFSKVSQAKVFAVGTRKLFPIGFKKVPITNENWNQISIKIASPADPREFSKTAIKRLLEEFHEYIVPFKNVRRKFKGLLSLMVMDFANDSERAQYQKAWEEYLKEKAKIEGDRNIRNARFLILVQFLKFRQAAEIIRSNSIARMMYNDWCEGYAPVYAANFKPSIAKVVYLLSQQPYNINRKNISIIWGGDSNFSGKDEDKYSREEIEDIIRRALRGEEIPLKVLKEISAQQTLASSGLGNLPPELELGPQDRMKRWNEIKRFQTGKSEFCFFTFKAGGAGLSLHQNKDYLRPRKQYNSPTYNEMECIQAEGRTAREGSLSNTDIITCLYRNTIEVSVCGRVSQKRKCLNVVMKHGIDASELGTEMSVHHAKEVEKIIGMLGPVEEDEVEEAVSQELYDEVYKEDSEEE